MIRFPMIVEPAIRPQLAALLCVFAVACVAGGLAPEASVAPLIAVFRAFAQPFRTLPHAQLFVAILLHNVVASFVSMIAGVVLGIVPVVSLAGNGFMLGAMCHQASGTHGAAAIIGRILPHGIFELPAMLIAAAYGLWLGTSAIARLRGREGVSVSEGMGHAVRRYLMLVLPLLIAAAAIESSLVPRPH